MAFVRRTAIVLMVWQTVAAFAQPTTTSTSRPAETRADRELAAGTARLEAERRAKTADLLRRYVAQLTNAKAEAVRAHEREEAQRLYEKIAAATATLDGLSPPPAVKAELTFDLKIGDYDGAGGFRNCVHVTETVAAVVVENDYDRPPAAVWSAKLTAEQHARLARFLRTFPLDRLKDRYDNPNVLDGYQVTFAIRVGDAPPRTVGVANVRVDELDRLAGEVNEVLPPRYALSRMRR